MRRAFFIKNKIIPTSIVSQSRVGKYKLTLNVQGWLKKKFLKVCFTLSTASSCNSMMNEYFSKY